MSATAFQRRRRELELKQQPIEEAKENVSSYDSMTKKELSELLDAKGVEYNARANKEELISLLKGVE